MDQNVKMQMTIFNFAKKKIVRKVHSFSMLAKLHVRLRIKVQEMLVFRKMLGN